MRRNALGIIAVFLFLIGMIAVRMGPSDNNTRAFAAGCIRIGLVLGAVWLALPQIQATFARAPGWIMSWFVGKKKVEQKPGSTNQPVVRPPQPRRRSNTR